MMMCCGVWLGTCFKNHELLCKDESAVPHVMQSPGEEQGQEGRELEAGPRTGEVQRQDMQSTGRLGCEDAPVSGVKALCTHQDTCEHCANCAASRPRSQLSLFTQSPQPRLQRVHGTTSTVDGRP